MFNHRNNNLSFLCSFVVLGTVVMTGQIFAAETSDFNLIADMLHTYIETREQNAYLNKSYNPKFEMDPFGAVMDDMQQQTTEVVLGGMQEIVAQAQSQGCGITQKNLTAMLHYFSDDFRSKMENQLGTRSDQSFGQQLDSDAAKEACLKFNRCYYPKGFPGDVMTDCREKILSWYREGYDNQNLSQSVKLVQLGKDKYWNTSLEDSPYDLFYDLTAISKIMFEDIYEPVPLYFFQVPAFLGGGVSAGGRNGISPN
jgi:hypothetical protein